jgi:hypothetical protein
MAGFSLIRAMSAAAGGESHEDRTECQSAEYSCRDVVRTVTIGAVIYTSRLEPRLERISAEDVESLLSMPLSAIEKLQPESYRQSIMHAHTTALRGVWYGKSAACTYPISLHVSLTGSLVLYCLLALCF